MAIIRKTTNNKYWQGCREKGTWYIVGGNEIGIAIMENSMKILQKIKIELPYDPAIPQKDIYISMLIATLFTKAKIQKQPKYPSTDEWIKN